MTSLLGPRQRSDGSHIEGGPDQRIIKRITIVNTLRCSDVPGTVLGTFYSESTKLSQRYSYFCFLTVEETEPQRG